MRRRQVTGNSGGLTINRAVGIPTGTARFQRTSVNERTLTYLTAGPSERFVVPK